MRPILSPSGQRLLSQFAGAHALLGFDFDGVLAPMVDEPARAAVRPSTRQLLLRLVRLCPCIIISGRSRRDVLGRVRGISLRVIGNHGAQLGPAPAVRKEVRRWRPLLRSLAAIPGVAVEDKGLSVAVHYRQALRKRAARLAILGCAAKLRNVRIVGGKDVVNILSRGAPSKGDALQRELRRTGCRSAIFIGDDDTDEDAFALEADGWLLAIRVGRKRDSLASHYLPRQADIDRLLRLLIAEAST